MGKSDVFKLCYAWLDHYVRTLEGRKHITIDIDITDDPTHSQQQYSIFNGFYGQFMYKELFFHDGETGQIIAPILRPGNSHSNKWYVSILKQIVQRIRAVHPGMKIIVRADSGFSCAPFYALAEQYQLFFAVGMASNEVLKRKVAKAEKAARHLYVKNDIKHQHSIGFTYQAGSWQQGQNCYAKVGSTGKGMNIRFSVSNMEQQNSRLSSSIKCDSKLMR